MKVYILFLVFALFFSSSSANSDCNDGCFSKTYCLSSDGSNICSKNNQITAKWSVIQREGEDLIELTLNGRDIKPTEDESISLIFQSPSASSTDKTIYSCFQSSSGTTSAEVEIHHDTTHNVLESGSSYYSKNGLFCIWSFTRKDAIYPLFYSNVNPMTNSDHQIVLKYGGEATGTVVATDTSDLPIYHLQYLKCCYKVYGSDYLIVTNQTDHNQYLAETMIKYPAVMTFSFRDADGVELLFTCDLSTRSISGSIKMGAKPISIPEQIYGRYVSNSRCLWSHELKLTTRDGEYDTTNGVYDLQITANDVIVFSEKGVPLRN